jgi:hypothetical protein
MRTAMETDKSAYSGVRRALIMAALGSATLATTGCTGTTDAFSLAPARAGLEYPVINNVPRGETTQMTAEEEIAMLTALNAELEGQETLTPAERALYQQRKRRLLQLARTNGAEVENAIDAR